MSHQSAVESSCINTGISLSVLTQSKFIHFITNGSGSYVLGSLSALLVTATTKHITAISAEMIRYFMSSIVCSFPLSVHIFPITGNLSVAHRHQPQVVTY